MLKLSLELSLQTQASTLEATEQNKQNRQNKQGKQIG